MADVDDAILHPSEFGVGFMGIDESFEESAGNIEQIPNPGAGQFLRELSRGPTELLNPEGIVILSARPNTNNFAGFIDDACSIFPPLWFACNQLKNFINDLFPNLVNQEINSVGSTVKAELGSPASDFLVTDFQDLWKNFADRKTINQAAFRAQNPGAFKYILVDDNANGGHVAAATMLNDPSSCVVVAFIHDVVNSPKNFINRPNPIHPLTGHMDPIPMPAHLVPVQNDATRYVLYRNFAHASILALQRGFISQAGKNRIVNAIKATTIYKNCVKQASKCAPGSDKDHCDPGCYELRNDVNAAAVFVLHREAVVQEVQFDEATAPCQCTAWAPWTPCDSLSGISSRQCLSNSVCVQYRKCTCNDCPSWSQWDDCASLTDSATRTCTHPRFTQCKETRPCTCADCDTWNDIGQCENPADIIFQYCQTPGFSICQTRRHCSCDDCPDWTVWSPCDGLSSTSWRRCRYPQFANCTQKRRCPADDFVAAQQQQDSHAEVQSTKATAQEIDDLTSGTCQCTAWSRWSDCENGISVRTCLTNPNCVERRQCTCDDCDRWVDERECLKPGDVVLQYCKTTGLEKCQRRRVCSCDDCGQWSDPVPKECTKGPGECLDIQCKTPGFEECKSRIVCTCDDCPQWSNWSPCDGLNTVSERRCVAPGWTQCAQQKHCPADDFTTKKQNMNTEDIDDITSAGCQCTLWSRWSPCDSITGTSKRTCLTNSQCVQSRPCTCDDCPTWTEWDKCDSLTDVSIRRCTHTRFPNCIQRKPCTCEDCQEYTEWSPCENGIKIRSCTHIPNCIQREECSCDDCDRWVDERECLKPGDVVLQYCKTTGLEKCQRRRVCSCDDCGQWSDPVPKECTKGPGECLDIQCKTPGFEECKSRIVCTCDDCPQWSNWSPCNGLNTVSERRCVAPGWTQCAQQKHCPADDFTTKYQQTHATAQEVVDSAAAPCVCGSWSNWSPCDGISDVVTRTCLTNPQCVQTKRCTCEDCPTWSDWTRCDRLTTPFDVYASTRFCRHRGFPNCVQRKPCTCADCQSYSEWSACENGVRVRKCTHIAGCLQTETCPTCDDCDQWVDVNKCSRPGDVVLQQCRTPGLGHCQKRKTCSCFDCSEFSDHGKCSFPGEVLSYQCKDSGFEECVGYVLCRCENCTEWSDWTNCGGLGTKSERRCKTTGWEQCFERKDCPAADLTSKAKQVHVDTQSKATVQDVDDITSPSCQCTFWGPWTVCDSLTGISKRICATNPNCIQTRKCTCADCKEFTAWSPCSSTGVRTRKCTHIVGCVQSEPCVPLTCAQCNNWEDVMKCSKPGDVVLQECKTPGLERCQRRRICHCDDCPEWSDWTVCSFFGGSSGRRCKTTGWEQCTQTKDCPQLPITSSKKQTAETQEVASSQTFAAHPPVMRDNSFATNFGGQTVLVLSSLCVFLTLAALIVVAVIRFRRHPPQQDEVVLTRVDVL